jgi:peptidoglycan/xylan/chitin deacetylase (PgdA/CDA1 family)
VKRQLLRAFYRATYLVGAPFRGGGITILSYHSLDDYGMPLSVSPRLFAAQMVTLKSEGCAALTMSQVAGHLQTREPFPKRAVAITFDDGFASFADVALPVLARYDLKATIYVITGMVGRRSLWTDGSTPLPSLPMLTWPQIDDLHRAGIEVGAHTITHGFLTQYSDKQLEDELQIPKAILEERLGSEVGAFAYPQGDYDSRVVQATRRAGYRTATTVDQGRVGLRDDPLLLPRLLVSDNVTPSVMRAFTVPSIGPAYRLINLVIRRAMGRKAWPRRQPGDVDSRGSTAV